LNFAKPHFGTQNLNETHKPTIASATTLDEAFAEWKQYKKLLAQDDLASN